MKKKLRAAAMLVMVVMMTSVFLACGGTLKAADVKAKFVEDGWTITTEIPAAGTTTLGVNKGTKGGTITICKSAGDAKDLAGAMAGGSLIKTYKNVVVMGINATPDELIDVFK